MSDKTEPDAQGKLNPRLLENRSPGVIDYDLRIQGIDDNAEREPRDAYCMFGARLGGASC